jgi:hypothetical protein
LGAAPPLTISSSLSVVTELISIATLPAPAPLATVMPPPGSKDSSEPTGASITGRRSLRPKISDDGSIFETLRSTRGLKAIESSAIRLRRSVVSVSVPPMR